MKQKLLMMLCLLSVTSTLQAQAAAYAGGDGTRENPYLISNADELAKLPKQKAKWYTLDSENYNMKLFRFAEKYGKQTYGSFYWCETVIDFAEELQNVRLAAGSNGASMWWLDGDEVLLLEGDRRMVEDDGTSRRLTLKPGRHVLRGAVINGPGLADMCVRFIDEKGMPVTNYKITVNSK